MRLQSVEFNILSAPGREQPGRGRRTGGDSTGYKCMDSDVVSKQLILYPLFDQSSKYIITVLNTEINLDEHSTKRTTLKRCQTHKPRLNRPKIHHQTPTNFPTNLVESISVGDIIKPKPDLPTCILNRLCFVHLWSVTYVPSSIVITFL